MKLFKQKPFEQDVEKATSSNNTDEDWSLILAVCDQVQNNPRSAKEYLRVIMKRMGDSDPHVVIHAITLLNACVNNCGKSFHLEIASREFETEFCSILRKAEPKVSLKMRQVLKSWAENDFKNDAELNLIPSLYNKLRMDGIDFSNLSDKSTKSAAKLASKDPNVVSNQQEADDIAKAIELSLKDAKSSPNHQAGAAGTTVSTSGSYSLYPSFSGSGSLGSITSTGAASNGSGPIQQEPRKVRALYDFEAAEENELTFIAGEIIHVQDDSDPNWWKGYNQRGDGLFPSNFVTADLSVDPETLDINQQNKSKKSVQFDDSVREQDLKTETATGAADNQRIEIDEVKIDRLLHLLHDTNPEDPPQDSQEMLRLEQEVHQMGPLIDAEMERVDRKHAQLTQLSADLVEAFNLYHSLMRDDRTNGMGGMGGIGAVGGMPGYLGSMVGLSGAMPGLGYQGPPNPHMMYGVAGYHGSAGSLSFPPQHTQIAHNFGMSSLPYTNAGPMPTTTVQTVGGPVSGTTFPPTNNQPPMSVPMHFQNGHMNPLAQHMTSPMGPGQHQQHQQQQQQQQQQQLPQQSIYGPPHQQLTQPNPNQASNYQIVQQQPLPLQHQHPQHPQHPQQQQQQQQFVQPSQTSSTVTTSSTMPVALGGNPQQQHQSLPVPLLQPNPQFMSPQQQQPHASYMPPPPQQQQHPQFASIPNGPQGFMSQPTAAGGVVHNNNNNNNNPDHFSQLQQQMAVMSVGINQPVTQSFLMQNESKNSIPIYQQQR